MKCHFPIIDMDTYAIAVLLCETSSQHVGLLLHAASGTEVQDPVRRKYYTAYAFDKKKTGRAHSCRLALLGNDLYNLRFKGKELKAEWRDIFIQTVPPHLDNNDPALRFLAFKPDSIATTPFRFPRWHLGDLQAIGFLPHFGTVDKVGPGKLPQTTVSFMNTPRCEAFRLSLGLCAQSSNADGSGGTEGDGNPAHWAWLETSHDVDWATPWTTHTHVCAEDHVAAWAPVAGGARARVFAERPERSVRVSFRPCRHSPQTTLVVHVELLGSVYEGLQRDVEVHIPPIEEVVRLPNTSTVVASPAVLNGRAQLSSGARTPLMLESSPCAEDASIGYLRRVLSTVLGGSKSTSPASSTLAPRLEGSAGVSTTDLASLRLALKILVRHRLSRMVILILVTLWLSLSRSSQRIRKEFIGRSWPILSFLASRLPS